jgi:hypothetical protein
MKCIRIFPIHLLKSAIISKVFFAQGKVEAELILLTAEEAEKSPAGLG